LVEAAVNDTNRVRRPWTNETDALLFIVNSGQLAAFDWAISDLNIEALHARDTNASPHSVMHGEA